MSVIKMPFVTTSRDLILVLALLVTVEMAFTAKVSYAIICMLMLK